MPASRPPPRLLCYILGHLVWWYRKGLDSRCDRVERGYVTRNMALKVIWEPPTPSSFCHCFRTFSTACSYCHNIVQNQQSQPTVKCSLWEREPRSTFAPVCWSPHAFCQNDGKLLERKKLTKNEEKSDRLQTGAVLALRWTGFWKKKKTAEARILEARGLFQVTVFIYE